MKKLLFLLLLVPAFAGAQIKTGRWTQNGAIISRPNDSTQIEDYNGRMDTLRVTWHDNKHYTLTGGLGVIKITVYRSGNWGYSGVAIMNKKKVYFEFIKVE